MERRLAGLPATLRSAALSWAQTRERLEGDLAGAPVGAALRGLPFLAKDLFDVAGVPTHAGSSFLARVRPVTGDSTLITRLRGLGAAVAGKTHLVEFAAGLTGENRTYGDCPHPFVADRLAGGSSSGSAALVAAGVTPFALGTDTGGSVRVPAACCGLFGYRGTPGDAFIRDAFPLSPTCDTAGWFTANAADLIELTAVLVAGFVSAASAPRGAYLRAADLMPDSPVEAACTRAAAAIAAPIEREARDALLASWRGSNEAYATIVMHEAHRIHHAWLEPHRTDYDPAIWQRFSDAGQITAEKVAGARAHAATVRRVFGEFFRTHDFLVLPCSPFPALLKSECTPQTRMGILTFTTPASLAGLPCVTVPVPLGGGLTAGLQIIAPPERPGVLRRVLEGLKA